MRIVLDIRYKTRSGAATYIDHIVPGLLGSDTSHEFILLKSETQGWADSLDCERVTVKSRPAAIQALLDQVHLPRMLKRLRADVYHPMKHLGTMWPPCAQVTTAHSITLPFRGMFPIGKMEAVYWRVMGTHMLRQSVALIAVSEYVRDFLVERIGIAPERIRVVHHGVDPRFHFLPASPTALSNEQSEYLLTVGNIFPVKNFMMAVKVFAAVFDQWPGLRLKMAGSTSDPHFLQIKAAVDEIGLAGRVDFLGFTGIDDLVKLFNGARLLLMPSLTEGCPVTLLEAMACGVPTIASARGGIPEIGRDAVVLIDDPHDAAAWISAARGLLDDADRRQRLREAMLTRAEHYTWPKAVSQTLAVYDSIA